MKQASFNIDVDPVWCYYAIHGIDYSAIKSDPIYTAAIDRFLEMLNEEDVKATFFITAKNFNDSEIEILQRVLAEGHEIASHSHSHDYRLIWKPVDEIRKDLLLNEAFFAEKLGIKPRGFRAPGYNTNSKLISVLKELEYSYDSSMFPSFSYYLAKWLIINLKKLTGKQSASFIASFRDAFSTYKPYYAGEKITDRADDKKLAEFPITTLLTVPFIGTSIIAFPEFAIDLMLKMLSKREFINIETHGIDLADVDDSDVYGPIRKIQPDLKHSAEKKLQRFRKVIRHFKNEGFEFKTLDALSE